VEHYDLCVIGSGPAGQRAAIQAGKLDKRVCVVERHGVVGGVAINLGTIPSKALREAILRVAGVRAALPMTADFEAARDASSLALLSACHEVIQAEVRVVTDQLRRNSVEIIHGTGRFRDPNTVDVIGPRGERRVTAEHVLIAVGTTPARPASIPFDGQNVITSDDILNMTYQPRTVIVVGGGVIGAEYASMLQALGVRVTLIEGQDRLLSFLDVEIIEALQYHLRQRGMTLRFGERVVRVEVVEPPEGARSRNDRMAEATLESGKTIRGDCLLYCVGRQGATEELNLPAAGLEADARGRLKVNGSFQTAVAHIYAAGDVIGFPALASTSMEQGRLAACHMFGQRCESIENLIPYGIYSIPEISVVGWTEEKLTAEGIPFEPGKAHYREIARGQLLGDDTGMLKLLVHQETHQVLGVHAIGTGATELIHIGQAAIAYKATVEYFVNAVFNYPTLAECYKTAAFSALNKLRNV
jgi:NAD(P) transhydrogenase